MRILALSGIVVAGILSGGQAQADCNIPQWLGTADGLHVPARGTLYVHDESFAWENRDLLTNLRLEFPGGEGTAHVRRVERTVAAIDYEGSTGFGFRVYDQWGEPHEMVLDATWEAPSEAPRVLQFWHHQNEWACSASDSLMIQIDQPVAGVRVRWTVHGHSVDYIEATRVDGTKTVLELGKINCGGENLPLEQLRDGGDIELFAIRFDGSEVAIRGMPTHVSLIDLEPHQGGLDRALTIVATQEPAAATLSPRTSRPIEETGRGLGIVVMVLAAFGTAGALWMIRRIDAAQAR